MSKIHSNVNTNYFDSLQKADLAIADLSINYDRECKDIIIITLQR